MLCCADLILQTAGWHSQVPRVEAKSPFAQFNTLPLSRVPISNFPPLTIYLHRSKDGQFCSITQWKTIRGQLAFLQLRVPSGEQPATPPS